MATKKKQARKRESSKGRPLARRPEAFTLLSQAAAAWDEHAIHTGDASTRALADALAALEKLARALPPPKERRDRLEPGAVY